MDESSARPGPADIDSFVRRAKDRGVADTSIVGVLRQSGWSERRVYRSLGAYYAAEFGIAVPVRDSGLAYARDAFYYLLNFISLGSWTVALGEIFYDLIARRFPDASAYPGYPGYARYPAYGGSLVQEAAWQLATVIVAFPFFVVVHTLIARELRRRPEAAESGVRSWLTYLALVVAATIVLGDTIWFLGSFLFGSLTARFVLDTLVVLVLGGGTFAYYLSSLRPREAGDRA
jgi:hypothetical protein